MTARALFSVTAVLFVGACSTTTHLNAVVSPADVARIRAENPGATLRVEVPQSMTMPRIQTSNGLPEEARLVDVTGDQTTLAVSSEIATRVLSNDAINRIVVVHRGQGAVEGMFVGAAVAVGAALVAAATYSGSSSADSITFSRGNTAEIVGFVVAVPAMALGAAIGALAGTRTNYTFGPAPAARTD